MSDRERAAAPPVAPEGLREAIGRRLFERHYRRELFDAADCRDRFLEEADAALSAITISGYVIRSREPDDATLERIAQVIAETHCTSDGWPVSGAAEVYDAAIKNGDR